VSISFCICTDFSDIIRLHSIIDSIRQQQIPEYEIVICGPTTENISLQFAAPDIVLLDFDETQREGIWITRKKNVLAESASYPTLVFLHDYVAFNEGWYKGLQEFVKKNTHWSAITNSITTTTGHRLRLDWISLEKPWTDYSETPQSIFASGQHFVTTKSIIEKYPFNEDLMWAQEEDVEWSNRIKQDAPIVFNPYSRCRLLKVHREG